MSESAGYEEGGYEDEVGDTYEPEVGDTYEPEVGGTYDPEVGDTDEPDVVHQHAEQKESATPNETALDGEAESEEEAEREGEDQAEREERRERREDAALEEQKQQLAYQSQPELESPGSVEAGETTEPIADKTGVVDPGSLPLDLPPDPAADGEGDVWSYEEPELYDMPDTGGYASTGWWASTKEPSQCCVVPSDMAEAASEIRPAELTFTSGGQASALSGYDGNGDGRVDIAGLDANGDGRVDTWLADTAGGGIANVMLIDTNGDGVPDAVSFDPSGAGGWSAPATLSSLPAPPPPSPSSAAGAPALQPNIGNYSTLFDQGETVTIGGHSAGAYGDLFQPSASVLLPGTDGGAYAGLFSPGENFGISPTGLSGPLLNLVNPGSYNPFPDNPNAGADIPIRRGTAAKGEVDLGANLEINRQNFRGVLNGLYG